MASKDFKPVVDACTLCDMCFMTKCPYVPPHEFNLDFPHLMLRHRAVEAKNDGVTFADRALAETDRNGRLAGLVAAAANWATSRDNSFTRGLAERVAGLHHDAALPKYAREDLRNAGQRKTRPRATKPRRLRARKAVIYATCFANYNDPAIGVAARAVLAKNGVETKSRASALLRHAQARTGDDRRGGEGRAASVGRAPALYRPGL